MSANETFIKCPGTIGKPLLHT